MKRRDAWVTAAWILLASPLILFIGLAIFALIGSTPMATIAEQLAAEPTRQAIWISLRTTLLSTGLVALFGTFLALAIARRRGWFSSSLELFVTLPAVLPPSVAGIALLLAFGRRGVLGPWLEGMGITIAFTPIAVMMAQAFVATPFFVRDAANGFRAVDPDLVASARLDGAGTMALVRHITLPLAGPFLISGLILAWTRALGEFGATILFAGNLQGVTQTMPLAIYLGFESDLQQAKALSVILLAISVLTLILVRLVFGRKMSFAH